jgi:hypothetical protein
LVKNFGKLFKRAAGGLDSLATEAARRGAGRNADVRVSVPRATEASLGDELLL